MIVYDPLYGRFEIEPTMERLVVTPEVRRLSGIRLLNAASLSLATLGEIRRYSHTLGVLYLSGTNLLFGASRAERRAFQAAVLLHDSCTPPFAHLFEYHLRDRLGWHHEAIISKLLYGFHAPENVAHQPFGGIAIGFRRALEHARIELEIVEQIVNGKHPLATLLFGTLDFDNLDNVARMALSLGLGQHPFVELARSLAVDGGGNLVLSESSSSLVRRWADLRRQVYDVIVFDAPTVAAQAVLSKSVQMAMEADDLHEEDWTLSDDGLVERLRLGAATKELMARSYVRNLPREVCAVQIPRRMSALGLRSRAEAIGEVEAVASRVIPRGKVIAYAFEDRGTFDKAIKFHDPELGHTWSHGNMSESVVMYVFSTISVAKSVARACADAIIERFQASGGQARCYWVH